MARPNPNYVEGDRSAPEAADVNVGLSPFLLERNQYVAKVRELKGATLSKEEMQKAYADFDKRWEAIVDKEVFVEAYRNWRLRGKHVVAKEVADTKPYKAMWGGGVAASPPSPATSFSAFSCRKTGPPTRRSMTRTTRNAAQDACTRPSSRAQQILLRGG